MSHINKPVQKMLTDFHKKTLILFSFLSQILVVYGFLYPTVPDCLKKQTVFCVD